MSDKLRQEFKAKDKAIKDDIKVQYMCHCYSQCSLLEFCVQSRSRARYTKRNVKRLKVLMSQNHSMITLHKVELEKSLQSLGGEVVEIKSEMAELKESVASVHKDMAEMKAIIATHFEPSAK